MSDHACVSFIEIAVGMLVMGGVLAGCTPDPVYRLEARAPDTTGFWKQGRQVVTQTVDSLQVAVSYARTVQEGHKFRLAFVNRSSAPVTVAPLGVYGVVTEQVTEVRYHNDTLETVETEPAADTLYALDPEKRLLEIDKDRSREEAEAQEAAATSAITATLDAVSDVAAPPQSPKERSAEAEEEEERRQERAAEKARHQRALAQLGRRRTRWAQSALRRTTIAPGRSTEGFVVVPVDPRAYTLVLHVDGGRGMVTVPFRQMRHKP